MKKITKEEYENFSVGLDNPIVREAMKLEVGEGLEVMFDDWHKNYQPSYAIGNQSTKSGKKFSSKTDKEVKRWLFLRRQ